MRTIARDITTIEEGVILHVVNNRGVMGAGVAKALFKKWPDVRRIYIKSSEYMQTQKKQGLELGMVQPITPVSGIYVMNMVAQDGYGRDGICYLDYDALIDCLVRVGKMVEVIKPVHVYIPYLMGCGLAGGDWDKVSEILKMTPFAQKIVICRLPEVRR